jgi:hypothetical protein
LGYGLDDRGSRVRFPVGAGNFSPHHSVQNGSGAHPTSYSRGNKGPFLGGKAAGHEADHSLPSCAEVKDAWSYTSSPPICLHGVVLRSAQGQIYLLPRPNKLCGPHNILTNGYRGLSPVVKLPGHEADHSHPPTTDVKKTWRYNSSPQYVFMT